MEDLEIGHPDHVWVGVHTIKEKEVDISEYEDYADAIRQVGLVHANEGSTELSITSKQKLM